MLPLSSADFSRTTFSKKILSGTLSKCPDQDRHNPACADPESFVRGGPSNFDNVFFLFFIFFYFLFFFTVAERIQIL